MSRYARCLSLLVVAAGLILFWTGTSSAIPAFSREHNTECTTCHTIYPELNEYGEAFLKNGFVWTKNKKVEPEVKAVAPKAEVKGEGDPDLLDKLKESAMVPNGQEAAAAEPSRKSEPLWLAGLPEKLPLSLAATLNYAYNDHPQDGDKFDFSTRAISLLAGGVIRDKVAFFVKYNLYTQGNFNPAVSNVPGNNDPDVEEAYFMWRKALNTPLNLKVGRFRPTLSLWKKTNKTSISDFLTTSYRVPDSQFTTDSTEDAIEVNAVLLNRLFVAGGIVDRDGQNTKEGYGHISYKFGGSDFNGKEPEVDLEHESFTDYLSVTTGIYGYSGRNSNSTASSQRNNFYRTGADMDILYKSLRLRLAGALGRDLNPDFASHTKLITTVFAAQAEYMFEVNTLGLFRYEHLDSEGIANNYIASVAYAPIENTKITLEYQHGEGAQISNQTLLGLRFAF
ncbi:MAG TPA: hypothetical protein VIU41_12875 [Geobacteraceae bacterium]